MVHERPSNSSSSIGEQQVVERLPVETTQAVEPQIQTDERR